MVTITQADVLAIVDTDPTHEWVGSRIVELLSGKIPDADAVEMFDQFERHSPPKHPSTTDIPTKIRRARTRHIMRVIHKAIREGHLEKIGDGRSAATVVKRVQPPAGKSGVSIPQLRAFIERQIVPVTLTSLCQHFLPIVRRDWVVRRYVEQQRNCKTPSPHAVDSDEYFWEAFLAYVSKALSQLRANTKWTVTITRPPSGDTLISAPKQSGKRAPKQSGKRAQKQSGKRAQKLSDNDTEAPAT